MDRRAFVAVMGSAFLAKPRAGAAQHVAKMPVVGILNSGSGQSVSVDAVRDGLHSLGWVEGRTIAFDVRFARARPEAFPGLAADLVGRPVDVIYVSGPAGVRAVSAATRTIPVVALDLESDPVAAGFARSLAQPGGNITGCFLDQPGLTGKWLELIGEAVPGVRRIIVLRDPGTGPWQWDAIRSAARTRHITLHVVDVRGAESLEPTLKRLVDERPQGQALVQLSSPLFDTPLAGRLADFTMAHHLPSISMFKRFADSGGLLAYGPDQSVFYKRMASFIDKILKGAKPGDLPIEQPTRFELVVNLKAAKALGLTIPPSILQRADQVIQ